MDATTAVEYCCRWMTKNQIVCNHIYLYNGTEKNVSRIIVVIIGAFYFRSFFISCSHQFECVFSSILRLRLRGLDVIPFFLLYVHLINVRETAECHHPKRVHNDVVAQNDEIEFWCSQRACDLWLKRYFCMAATRIACTLI